MCFVKLCIAGWINKEDYGESNLFFRHDIANGYVDSSLKSILEACVTENDAERHASNIQDKPVMIRIGMVSSFEINKIK